LIARYCCIIGVWLAAVAPPQIEQPSVATSGSQPRDDLEAGETDGGDNESEQS
jgi:hypothetical protein